VSSSLSFGKSGHHAATGLTPPAQEPVLSADMKRELSKPKALPADLEDLKQQARPNMLNSQEEGSSPFFQPSELLRKWQFK
jgi:hypothetical protein